MESSRNRRRDGNQLGFAGGDVLICVPSHGIRREGSDDDDALDADHHIHHRFCWWHLVDAVDLCTEEENYSYSYHRDTEPSHLHFVGEPRGPAVRGVAGTKPRSLRPRRFTTTLRRSLCIDVALVTS